MTNVAKMPLAQRNVATRTLHECTDGSQHEDLEVAKAHQRMLNLAEMIHEQSPGPYIALGEAQVLAAFILQHYDVMPKPIDAAKL